MEYPGDPYRRQSSDRTPLVQGCRDCGGRGGHTPHCPRGACPQCGGRNGHTERCPTIAYLLPYPHAGGGDRSNIVIAGAHAAAAVPGPVVHACHHHHHPSASAQRAPSKPQPPINMSECTRYICRYALGSNGADMLPLEKGCEVWVQNGSETTRGGLFKFQYLYAQRRILHGDEIVWHKGYVLKDAVYDPASCCTIL